MAALTVQDVRVLDQTRQRLAQLTSSLTSLQAQIYNSDPLPPWPSLQLQTQILSQTLSSLANHLTSNSTLLYSTAAFPLPSFPGSDQEALLNQLLRKKLEPGVEDWVEEGQRAAGEVAGATQDSNELQQWRELWEWAAIKGNEQAREHSWGGMGEEEEEESSDEDAVDEDREAGGDVEMDDGKEDVEKGNAAPPLRIEQVLKFMSRGEMPSG